MSTFVIGLIRCVWETTTTLIDAENADEAERLAIQGAIDGSANVEWRFLDASDPPEAVSSDQL